MKKSSKKIQDFINAINGDSKDYHCQFCQNQPSCFTKDGHMYHSSYCKNFKDRIEHDNKLDLINTDCITHINYDKVEK